MRTLLAPGITLLNYLRYPQKFALMLGLLIVPLILAIALLQSETVPRIEFTQQELAGSHYIRRLGNLYDHIQESYQLVGNSDTDQFLAQQATIANEIAALKDDQATFDGRQRLEQIEALVQRLKDPNMLSSRGALEQAHVTLLAAVGHEVRRVADASNLILDPELAPYYLMSIAVVETPERVELLARVPPLANSQHVAGGVAAQQALFVAGQLDSSRQQSERSVQVALSGDPTLEPLLAPLLRDSSASSEAVVAMLKEIGTGAAPPADAQQRSQAAYGASMQLWRTSLSALDARLEARVTQLQQKNLAALGVAGVMLVGIAYLLMAFYSSIMHAVRTLDQASKQALTGGTIQLNTRDELGEVVTSFNRVVAALAQENTERVASESERARLQAEIIQAQSAALDELSVPIIRLGDGVVLLPLIGTIDTRRSAQILETLLAGVGEHRATLAILDLTGVRLVDTQVAGTLIDAVSGARLLGAQVALVGLQADVAQTIARLGIDMRAIAFYATLQDVLHYRADETWADKARGAPDMRLGKPAV
jgi:anti-anti-sigma regulatory factor